MKHGVRIWQKKLGRSPTHRKSLLVNLLTELVRHEQIQTTLAKAQFLKHEMEKMINIAKRGTSSDWKWVQEHLNSQDVTVPKLMHILANRYKDRGGGYVRIIKHGHRASASDRAPLAIIELINNENDVIYHLASKENEKLTKQLKDIEEKRYIQKTVDLVDPKTGNPIKLVRLKERPTLKVFEKRKIMKQELAIRKKLIRYNKSLVSYPIAREVDNKNAETLSNLEPHESNPFFVPPVDRLNEALPVGSKIKYVTRRKVEKPKSLVEVTEKTTQGMTEETAEETTEETEQAKPEEPKEAPPPPPKSFMQKYFGRFFK